VSGQSDRWQIVQSDVLVIGGGFGGLWSAIRAAGCGSTVTLVDRSFAGKSGHSFFAGGAMMVLLPEDDLDECIRDIVAGNGWLIDQEMVEEVFKGSFYRLKDLESFGMSFRKSGGTYLWTRARGTMKVKNLWPANATAGDEVTLLRKIALSTGLVRIIDHAFIYDLAKASDGTIAGALGAGVQNPENYLFKAKGVILATNSGGYRGHHLASELQGLGPFMAFDAGAKIKNPEFHYINMRPAKHEIEGSGILPAIGARWVNGKGEHFMEQYDPLFKDRAPVLKIVQAAAREARAGKAPISMDVEGITEEEREKFRTLQVSHGWMPLLFEKCAREEGYDPLRNNIEWKPAYECNKLGLLADAQCRTSLKGLFAAGMARTLGINPFTGWSIAACTWSGYTAGESCSRYASANDWKSIDFAGAEESRSRFMNPLGRERGLDPDKVVHDLQKILFPADVLILMKEGSLNKALDGVLALKEESLSRMAAADLRTLIKARETATMLLSAEMTLKASLMRRESRDGIFFREDFPEPDNANWLKWILVEKGEKGEMKFSTEDVPFARYRFRPSS